MLATSIVEKLHAFYPDAAIDLVVRKGNDGLFGTRIDPARSTGTVDPLGRPACAVEHAHPFLRHLYVWDKRDGKTRALFALIGDLRRTEYDHIINSQRFFSTGLLTALARGKKKIGYDKNPLSFLFTRKVKHDIGNGRHEVDRLNDLIEHLTDRTRPLPRLYPSTADRERVHIHTNTRSHGHVSYVTIAPASVWFTKQWPEAKWIELIKTLPPEQQVYLIGAPGDSELAQRIIAASGRGVDLTRELKLLESAALMEGAVMNYVNDSAPLHIASAMNAPVTAVFCSTVPAFGFGPFAGD
ncbi:MAG: glycosyltransferase family 9 protein [Flavobacteriales bacterium]